MTTLPSPNRAASIATGADQIFAEVHTWPLFARSVVHAREHAASDDVETFELWLHHAGATRRVVLERRASADVTTLVFTPGADSPITTVRHAPGVVADVEFRTAPPARSGTAVGFPIDPVVRTIVADLLTAADLPGGPGAWLYTFEDSVRTHGRVADVLEFLRKLEVWPEHLAHVHDVTYVEDEDGIQTVSTTVLAHDGTPHQIPSIRICLDHARVIYKPLTVPPIAHAHLGQWLVEQHAEYVTVSGRHTVALDPAGMRRVLGDGAAVDRASRHVRAALGKHSLDTLDAAKSYAESRLRAHDPALSWERLGTA